MEPMTDHMRCDKCEAIIDEEWESHLCSQQWAKKYAEAIEDQKKALIIAHREGYEEGKILPKRSAWESFDTALDRRHRGE